MASPENPLRVELEERLGSAAAAARHWVRLPPFACKAEQAASRHAPGRRVARFWPILVHAQKPLLALGAKLMGRALRRRRERARQLELDEERARRLARLHRHRREIDLIESVPAERAAKVARWRERGSARVLQRAVRGWLAAKHGDRPVRPRKQAQADQDQSPASGRHGLAAQDRGGVSAMASHRAWDGWAGRPLRWEQEQLDRAEAAMAELRDSGGQAAGPGLRGRAGDVFGSLRRQSRGGGGGVGASDGEADADQDGAASRGGGGGVVPLGWAAADASRWDAEDELPGAGGVAAGSVRVAGGPAGLVAAARRLLARARRSIAAEADREGAGASTGPEHRSAAGGGDAAGAAGAAGAVAAGGPAEDHASRPESAAADGARTRALELWAEQMTRGPSVGRAAAAAREDDRARAARLASLAAVAVAPPALCAVIRGEAGEGAAPGSAEAAARAVEQLQPPPGPLREAGAAANASVLRAVERTPDGWWRMGAAGSEADVRAARLALPWRSGAGAGAPGWPQSLPSQAFGGRAGGAAAEGECEGGEASDWWLAYLAGVGGTAAGAAVARAVDRARAEATEAGSAAGSPVAAAAAAGRSPSAQNAPSAGSALSSAEHDKAVTAAVASARAMGVAPMLETLAAAQPPGSIHLSGHVGHGDLPGADGLTAGTGAADQAGETPMPQPPGRAQLALWGLDSPGLGETRHVASGMAPPAADAARRGPRLPPSVVGAAMERLGVADPWSPGLHNAIARSAFQGPEAMARHGRSPEGDPGGDAASRQESRRAAAEDAEAAASAAEAEAEAAAGEAARRAEQEVRSSAAVLAALRDPDDPLSLASALRAAPAVGMPELSLPWAEAPVRMDERGEAGRRWTKDGLEVIRLATRMPASLGIAGRSMDERVMAAVAQMRRQREAGERADAARADARQLQARLEATAQARAAAEQEDQRQTQPVTTPRQPSSPARRRAADGASEGDGSSAGAQGVALPASALQQVRGADGEQLLVLTADQLRALAAAVGPGSGSGPSRQRHARARPAPSGSPETRHRTRSRTDPSSARGSPSRKFTEGSSLDISRDTELSEGALAVGVRVKQSFGAAATPSAPRGGAPARWMSPGPRPASPLRSPARAGRERVSRPAKGGTSSQAVRESLERPYSAAALGEA